MNILEAAHFKAINNQLHTIPEGDRWEYIQIILKDICKKCYKDKKDTYPCEYCKRFDEVEFPRL